jgi:hypothetical protein
MSQLSLSDAVVALRSFPRRFSESVVGPIDDDAFVRSLLRAGADGFSVIDVIQQTAAHLDGLATTLAALPRISVPSTSTTVRWTHLDDLGEDPKTTLTALLSDLKRSAVAAADAAEARRGDDLEREVHVDSGTTTIGAFLDQTVQASSHALRSIGDRLNAPA